MNPLVPDDWTDELDDFYDHGQFYSDYESLSFFDDLIKPTFNTGKIVELIDTGCDARSSRLHSENNKFTKNPPRASNCRDSKTKRSVEGRVPRRSSGDTRASRSQHLPTNDDVDSLNKTSLDNLVVSSITFNVADRETKDEDFEDFEDVDEMDFRELQSRKRFTDRAVDSDCLSNSSRPSMDNNSSASSTTVNLRRKNLKVRTQEITSSKAAGTKQLRKSNESVDEKSPFVRNARAKIGRWSRTSGPSSTVRNSRDTKNVRSKINLQQSGRKLESVSRTIIKDQQVKVKKERSEIPRPTMREGGCTLKRDNRKVKKPLVQGSRLPVWQGRRRKSKITSSFHNSRTTIAKDEDEVGGVFNPASRVERKYSEEEIRKIDKNRKIIIEDDPEEVEKVSARSSKLGESVEWQRVRFEREEIGGQSEVKNREEIKGDVENRGKEELKEIVKTQSRAETKDITGNKVVSESKTEDQSKSDLWSKNYEEAFAKGRAVGLRVYKMAKAAREERKREFRKYGFEDYKRMPRETPQEIVDIGVTLLEKVLDDGKENYYKRNSNVRDRVSQRYFIP